MSNVFRSMEVMDEYILLEGHYHPPMEEERETALDRSEEAEKTAEIILQESRYKAEEITVKAQEEAKRILEKAKAEEEAIRRAAEERGYREGYEQAYGEAQEELDAIRGQLYKTLHEAQDERAKMILQAEGEVVDLSLAIAGKVVRHHVDAQRDTVLRLAKEGLEGLAHVNQYTILVNPDDVGLLEQYVDELQKHTASSGAHIHVFADEQVSRGGCKIETEKGFLDATLESQLDIIRRAISEEYLK
ncbi:MAG: hypothetical protein GX318_04675 [Clostridia bacterium]|nr:hypothetical protein [Clostridia bacterium]